MAVTRETRIWWASLAISVLAHGLGAMGVRALPAREGRLDAQGGRSLGAEPEPAPMYLFTADVPAPSAEPAPEAPQPAEPGLVPTVAVMPEQPRELPSLQPPPIDAPAPEVEATLAIGTEGGTPGARAVVPSAAEGEMVGQLFTRESPQMDLRETAPVVAPPAAQAPAPEATPATVEAPLTDLTAPTAMAAPPAPAAPAREAQEAQEAQKAREAVQAVSAAGGAGGEAPKEPAREAQQAQVERAAQLPVQASAGSDARPTTATATAGEDARPAGASVTGAATVAPAGPPSVPGDRDSDAFSVTRTGVFRNGRVEAGEGLEIRTVRPQFTLLTRVTAAPGAPRVRVVFGKDGRVKDAKIMRSSGYALEIDEPVLAAVFNWRASGHALRDLPNHPGATLRLDLTVVLVR